MTVLVTGGNGFVGRVLLAMLTHRGLDGRAAIRQRIDTGSDEIVSGVPTYRIGDIGPATDWSAALEGVDTVIHLAARVHVMKETAEEPLAKFRNVNTLGTIRLASIAAESGVRRFVYVSTIKVNGESTADRPFHETDAPCPTDPYALSKWEAEQGLSDISMKTGLEVVVVRPPLVYGPGVGGNFRTLLGWVARGVPLPFGSVDNKRSLVGVENLVDLLITCAVHPSAAGQVFLASDEDALSTPELLRRVARALEKPVRVVPFPVSVLRGVAMLLGKQAQCERLCGSLTVDASKACTVLGWRPPFSVDEGLKRTADWYRDVQR